MMMDKEEMGCSWGQLGEGYGSYADCDNAYIKERIIVNNDSSLQIVMYFYYITQS